MIKQTTKFFGYSILYFDTNVYLALSRKPDSWKKIRKYILEGNFLLAVSDVNVLELSDKQHSLENVARFLLQVPSALLKPTVQIMEDEAMSFLHATDLNPFVGPISTLILEVPNPIEFLVESLFHGQAVGNFRKQMIQQKPTFVKRIKNTMDNFIPTTLDKYCEADGINYASLLICDQILPDWPRCARKVREYLCQAKQEQPRLPAQFQGMWLFALAQFYRYYLHRRTPEGNDYGDFLHVVPIPYSRVSILEGTLRDDLCHMKRSEPMLNRTDIHSLAFLRELTGIDLG